MNLEARVTRGFTVYIHDIIYSSENKKLVIKFIKNPADDLSIVRILTFSEIQCFSEEIDVEDFDEDCLDSLIGIQEYVQKNGMVRYVVRTEQREIIFLTNADPHI